MNAYMISVVHGRQCNNTVVVRGSQLVSLMMNAIPNDPEWVSNGKMNEKRYTLDVSFKRCWFGESQPTLHGLEVEDIYGGYNSDGFDISPRDAFKYELLTEKRRGVFSVSSFEFNADEGVTRDSVRFKVEVYMSVDCTGWRDIYSVSNWSVKCDSEFLIYADDRDKSPVKVNEPEKEPMREIKTVGELNDEITLIEQPITFSLIEEVVHNKEKNADIYPVMLALSRMAGPSHHQYDSYNETVQGILSGLKYIPSDMTISEKVKQLRDYAESVRTRGIQEAW